MAKRRTGSYQNAPSEKRRPSSSSFLHPPSSMFISFLIAGISEFAGTFMYLFFAFLLHSAAVSQQPPDQPPKPLTILTICAGYAFFYAFWLIINGIMLPTPLGGYFNPAITLGRVVAGALHSLALAVLIPAQIMGAVSAAAVVKAVVNPGEEGLVKIQVFLAPGINVTQGLVIEMFLTLFLVIIVLIWTGAEDPRLAVLCPVALAFALFFADFIGLAYTGGSLNPVRAFAPCVVSATFPSYHWLYWGGPFLAAVIAGGYFRFMKYCKTRTSGDDSSGGSWNSSTPAQVSPFTNTAVSIPLVSAPSPPPTPQGAPTLGKPRKATVVRIQRPGADALKEIADDEKEDVVYDYLPRSPYDASPNERRVVSWGSQPERDKRRDSDMDRYERARGFQEAMG